MFSTRLLNLLVVALSVFAIVQATYVDVRIIETRSHALVRRQKDGTSVDADADPTTDPSTSDNKPTKTDETTTPSSTPTPTDKTTDKTSEPPSSTEKDPTSSKPTKSTPSSSEKTQESSSSPPRSTVTHIVTQTNEDGTKTTKTEVSTPTADLQDGGGNNESSGMSPQTRKIIIGVVVGVGGAIVLGGVGLIAFRIWGRKKSQREHDDMGFDTGYQPVEKADAGNSPAGRSPFQSTLESYHAPSQVNTASNF